MTIATDLGFVVDEKYKVVTGDGDVTCGEVLTFKVDDDSICPYFLQDCGDEIAVDLFNFMVLPGSKLKTESLEDLIQKRDEAKEALSKAQQELDEKLEFLGLQRKDNAIASTQSEDFEWEESDWREFEVGDEIKVDESTPIGKRNIFFGKVILKKNPQCCGYEGYPLFVKNNETQYKKWIESLCFMYKKVNK